MLLANDAQQALGKRYLAAIRRTHFAAKNPTQQIFDGAPDHWKRLLCFHAGLKARHITLSYAELTQEERRCVIEALRSLMAFARTLPRFLSDNDCTLRSP
ncbi:hypothetical protein [Chimaeribacter arupi]|uniref:hypothetical protein n=1 Tax=Chimaeribacter arupi TaxID=2060066 RepID=UPI000C7A55E2|nr:hypothetical protein [Chimaeribacter arupi]PLR33170.1 hypothetical protein CYR23_12510 [Chimaeribacter arupi]